MNLIIVESPTKARTLARFLGKDFAVEATMGHIKDLPKSKLSIDVENNFDPQYVDVPDKEKVIRLLQKMAKKAKTVYLATDPDREGEAISAHVKEVIGDGKTQRIVFHEITKEAIEEALKNPRGIDINLVSAQTARRVLDRLVGYKLSPLLWKKVRRGLSAGRVQSVAVRLVVEREREIEAFKPKEYWEIDVEVAKKDKQKFIVRLIKKEINTKKSADGVVGDLTKANYSAKNVTKKEVKKNPYPPFTTSTLTQAAARLLGWSSKKTMSVAQSLYEEGKITYHRTDSVNMAASAVAVARKYIQQKYGANYLPSEARGFKRQSKLVQEAHEAIRPTNVNVTEAHTARFEKDSTRLYSLIWKRFIACQMSQAVYNQTTVDVSADSYLLRATGTIMQFDGWRRVFGGQNPNETEAALPDVIDGEPLDLVKVMPNQKFTTPPPRYNEASLIKTLEKLGIGRPSTYAPTISTIQIRSYVEKDEGAFKPTTVGVAVNDFLVKNFPEELEYSFTAKMEDGLDSIAKGDTEWHGMIKDFWGPFVKKLGYVEEKSKRVKIETEKLGRKCPECKEGELVIRTGRFGKFISCSRFPECRHTEKLIDKAGMKCPECKDGDVIIKRTKRGRKFFGCSRYPDCKWASWTKPQK